VRLAIEDKFEPEPMFRVLLSVPESVSVFVSVNFFGVVPPLIDQPIGREVSSRPSTTVVARVVTPRTVRLPVTVTSTGVDIAYVVVAGGFGLGAGGGGSD